MKKVIFAVALLANIAIRAVAAPSLDINTEDPEIKVIRTSFPQAKGIHKIAKQEGYTEFDFQVNHKNMAVIYNRDGKLVETDSEISYNELPVAIKESVGKNFTEMKITSVKKVSYSKSSFYKLGITSEGKEYSVGANNDGQITIFFK